VFSIVEGAHQVCRYGHDARRYNQPKQLPLGKGEKTKKSGPQVEKKKEIWSWGFHH